jgi:hypothetical protein
MQKRKHFSLVGYILPILNQTHLIESGILLATVRGLESLLRHDISSSLQAIGQLVNKIASGELGEDFAALENVADDFEVVGTEIIHPFSRFERGSTVINRNKKIE